MIARIAWQLTLLLTCILIGFVLAYALVGGAA